MPLKVARNADNVLTRVRQIRNRLRLVMNADVGIPHSHVDVGMPCQFFGFWQCGTIPQQSGDETVPPGGMKVGDTFWRDIRNPGYFQILLDHQPRSAFGQFWKQKRIWRDFFEPVSQHGHQLRM
ncbi:MAG: hypothetical protein NT138_02880 [Planctomycetales bacterium]|nr:hypothetical protein [Planctomycetales bacterium]